MAGRLICVFSVIIYVMALFCRDLRSFLEGGIFCQLLRTKETDFVKIPSRLLSRRSEAMREGSPSSRAVKSTLGPAGRCAVVIAGRPGQ